MKNLLARLRILIAVVVVGAAMIVAPASAQAVPSTNCTSQTLEVDGNGGLWHNIRYCDGSWQGWRQLDANVSLAAIAGMPGGSAQVVKVDQYRNVMHSIRLPNGNWTPWQGLGFPNATAVSIAAMPDGSAQVVAVNTAGTLWHTIRHTPSGSWDPWAPVGNPPAPRLLNAAITGMPDGSSQVVVSDENGGVWHNVRYSNGTWQSQTRGWGKLDVTGFSVSIAGMPDGSAQVVESYGLATCNGDSLDAAWNIRRPDGSWTGWGGLYPAVGCDNQAVGIAALPDGSSQLLVSDVSGTVYHSRHDGRGWSPFGSLGLGGGVAIAGFPYGP